MRISCEASKMYKEKKPPKKKLQKNNFSTAAECFNMKMHYAHITVRPKILFFVLSVGCRLGELYEIPTLFEFFINFLCGLYDFAHYSPVWWDLHFSLDEPEITYGSNFEHRPCRNQS